MAVIRLLYIMISGRPIGRLYSDPLVTMALAQIAIDGTVSPQDGEGDNDTTVIFCQYGLIVMCPPVHDFILIDVAERRVDKCPDICLFFQRLAING
jgi:hypothetical protein